MTEATALVASLVGDLSARTASLEAAEGRLAALRRELVAEAEANRELGPAAA